MPEPRPKTDCEMLLRIIAHQLRTPLTTMRWFLDPLLADKAGKFTMEQLEFFATISQSTERMIHLLDTVLNVGRTEDGQFKVYPEIIDIRIFLEKLYKAAEPLKEQEQKFSVSSDQKIGYTYIDRHLLYEVLFNLLTNAFRYTPKNGDITLSAHKKDAEIIFSVKDTGYGIPEDEQKQIFQKMFRASNATEKFPQGTGLGLYVAKLFTERLNGSIWFESEKDKGTEFFVSIPIITK